MKTIVLTLGLILLCWQSQAIAQTTSTASCRKDVQEQADQPAAELVTEGKALYRTARFKLALAKFEAALKQEPDNDEALGLAAETAFRLDSQAAARDYFLHRADLSGQKDSVKAYSYHRAAMTCWREAHDLVAKYIEVKNGKAIHHLPESTQQEVSKSHQGRHRICCFTRSESQSQFCRCYATSEIFCTQKPHLPPQIKRLRKNHQHQSLDDLRWLFSMSSPLIDSKAAETADFNFPTIRISEFAGTKEDQDHQADEMMKAIEGGKPIKRKQPIFPRVRPGKPGEPTDAATNTAYSSGKAKVEVLVSTEGKVIFSHVIDGRSDLNSAAILAARAWTFEPAMLDGQPVQVSGVISFDLK